eukprot:gene14109-18930_t
MGWYKNILSFSWLYFFFVSDSISSVVLHHLETHFHEEFEKQCMKYPFVENYYKKLENPGENYVVMVFQENRYSPGGLGDRLAGVVNAFAVASRLNRTLLIKHQSNLGELFRPYHPSYYDKQYSPYNYSDWSWTNYDYSLENNDNTEYDLWFCHNANGNKNAECGVDNSEIQQHIIKMKTNRVYLCRWDKNPFLLSHTELRHILEVNENDDLFQVAGCMLRLALWPTPMLWDEIKKKYKEFYPLKLNEPIHFRCGDQSYHGGDSSCRFDGTNHASFKFGTPVDLSNCALEVMRNYSLIRFETDNHKNSILYITSDSEAANQQIQEFFNHSIILIAPKGCHIELDSSSECLNLTVIYWFILSLSDTIVTQNDNHHPSSGYSRFAALYGLKQGTIALGNACGTSPLNGRNHQGNWFC